jgi:NAD-reducing hydrogenase small subunit
MSKARIATVWLDGCSGCHMSLLDMDETIAALAARADIVYGPLVDAQTFPEGVDVTLVEGAVSSEEDAEKLRLVRSRSRVLVALGDCAVTGNVPAMRNPVGVKPILERIFLGQVPTLGVPPLLPHVMPLQQVVKVDLHVPGCPPPPAAIVAVVGDLLAGKLPDLKDKVKFG